MARRTVRNISIEKLAHGGDGLAHLEDGRVIFVEGGVPGDVVDVDIRKEKKSWARGRVAKIRTPSEARVPVECDAFERGCGGCQFWDVDYKKELNWKVTAAREAIERISKLELPEIGVTEAPSIWDYRNRITVHQRRLRGNLYRGFYEAGSHQIVEVEQCPVARPSIDEAIAEIGGPLSMLGDADITIETAGDGTAVVLVELLPGQKIRHAHLEELSTRVEQGVVVRGAEILDERGKYFIIGDTTVAAEEVLAYPPVEGMRVESGRFRQANRAVNINLVDFVTAAVTRDWEKPRILELYCGSGNFSFPLASLAEDFVGYEGSRGALETARRIAELSEEMDHVRFEVADLSDEEVVVEVLDEPFEVLVLDPPREGAAEVVSQVVQNDREGMIVYVACDAACLARDMKTLAAGGWELKELAFFDMFPRTSHLESVAIMTRLPE